MKQILTITAGLVILLSINCPAQLVKDKPECGVRQLSETELSKRPGFGNNQDLLDVLKKNGYELPDDYFDKVDEKGHYKGKRVTLADYVKKNKSKDKSDGGQSFATYYGTKYYFPVKIWVHTNASNQSPITQANLLARFNAVIDAYNNNNSPIVFYRLWDITYVPNSPHNILETEEEEDVMFNDYHYGPAINVHIVFDATKWGSADQIPGSSCYVTAGAAQNTLAHELGHCMGLLHTHNAFPPCGGNDNEECADCWQEPVSRTRTQPFWCYLNVGKKKCSVYGDQLCDTPGERDLSDFMNTDCSHDYLFTDNWGSEWQPMQYNIMSYARVGSVDCRNLFSAGQNGIMLAKKPWNAPTDPGYTIDGNSSVCESSTHTYSVPALFEVGSYEWRVSPGVNILSGQGSNQITVSFSYSGSHEITVIPDCCFPLITKNVYAYGSPIPIYGPALVSPYSQQYYSTDLIYDAYYEWTVPGSWYVDSGQGTYSISTTTGDPGYGTIYVYMSSPSLGCNLWGSLDVEIQDGAMMSASQPISTSSDVKQNDKDLAKDASNAIIINLYTSKVVAECNEDGLEAKLNELPSGFYAIKKLKDNKLETFKLFKVN